MYALPFAANTASCRVLEKAGYVLEGRLRRSAIKNDGLRVSRRPLTALETFAQVLLLSNEAAYVN